jgi:hypothetical protein
VIGNAQKPHCLRGINISNLPVSYYWNKKAWMTQDIFRHLIKILDNKFRVQKRQVLILLDNASSHLEPKKKEANNNEVNNLLFILYIFPSIIIINFKIKL